MRTRLTQAYQQAPWRQQVQWIGLFALLLILVAGVASIYLTISSQAALAGRQIQGMEYAMETMDREVADNLTRLAEMTSSIQMEKRATALGFKPIELGSEVYIPISGYTPRQSVISAPPPVTIQMEQPLIQPEYATSLWDWFSSVFLARMGSLSEVKP